MIKIYVMHMTGPSIFPTEGEWSDDEGTDCVSTGSTAAFWLLTVTVDQDHCVTFLSKTL